MLVTAFALGVEIVGAWLVARGIFAGVVDIAAEANDDDRALAAALRDRLDAQYGIPGLIFGFGLQIIALAYAQLVQGPTDRASITDALLVLIAGLMGAFAWYLLRRMGQRRILPWIVEVARFGTRQQRAYETRLLHVAQECGFPMRHGESVNEYLDRLFPNVERTDEQPIFKGIVLRAPRRWPRLPR